MKILFIASECAPIAKVGGLADVVGSLPKTLKNLGIDVSIVMPFYGSIKRNDDLVLFKKDFRVDFDGKKQSFDLWLTHLDKVPVFLIKNDHYFSGRIYLEKDASSGGSEKEASRFLFLSAAAIRVAQILKTDIFQFLQRIQTITVKVIKRRLGFIDVHENKGRAFHLLRMLEPQTLREPLDESRLSAAELPLQTQDRAGLQIFRESSREFDRLQG